MTIEHHPIEFLYLHDLNPRGDTGAEDAALMAAAIRDVGLIQSLAGYRDPAHDGIGIVAGGRRLRGLTLLVQGGDLPAQLADGIPVMVTDDALTARTWASAENERLPLDKVDQVRAFAAMAENGLPVASIARACAVTENLVRRRLKLAALPDPVLDALKAREISLDVAAAMTTTNDQERVLRLLDDLRGRNWSAARVRGELHSGQVRGTDRRAIFVGLEAYEAAGGNTTRDLFSEDSWLHNEDLLDRLFATQLAAEAERVQQQGWEFVLTTTEPTTWSDDRLADCEEIEPTPVELPEADAAELAELEKFPSWEMDHDQRRRMAELQRAARGTFTPEERAGLGIMLFVDHDGDLVEIDGLRRRAPAPETQDTAQDATDTDPEPEDTLPAISQALRDDLGRVVLHQRQRALADHPQLALDLLAYHLSGLAAWSRPYALDIRHQDSLPSITDGLDTDPRLEVPSIGTATSAEGFAEFRARGQKHRNKVLTEALARLLGNSHPDDLAALLDNLTGVSIRSHWTPTAQNLFSRLRRSHLEAIFDQVIPDADPDRREDFRDLPVKEQAVELEDLFTIPEVQDAWGLTEAEKQRLAEWVPAEMAKMLGDGGAVRDREE